MKTPGTRCNRARAGPHPNREGDDVSNAIITPTTVAPADQLSVAFERQPNGHSVAVGTTAAAPMPSALDDFWRFIVARHEIFIRRHLEHRQLPWTDDPLLQHGRYTEIYRDLDRATRWLVV